MAGLYQPSMGEDLESESEDSIHIKSQWQRKGERVNFFTRDVSNTDFFDLVSNEYS